MANELYETPVAPSVPPLQTSTDIDQNSLSDGQNNIVERVVYVHEPATGWTIAGITGAVLLLILILGIVASLLISASHPATTSSSTNGDTTTSGMNMNMGSTSTNQNGATVPQIAVPAHQTYNAQPPAVAQGNTVNLTLTVKELLISIAPDVAYHAWTFNGTVPGPILHVRQGQTVHFTLINDGAMPHSIDFHAAQTPWSVNYQDIPAGKSFSFNWQANYPGVFMYHCGAPVTIYHMANGMYGEIIVDPANGWAPATEYSLVQSEFYTAQQPDGTYSIDPTKLNAVNPDYVVFNGYVNQYKAAPLVAKAGERIRLFIVNAGPSEFSAFHVIGAIFSDVYIDGNPANHTIGDQTVTVPPGGGVVVELTIPEPGLYPFVSHSFSAVGKGALGVIKVIP